MSGLRGECGAKWIGYTQHPDGDSGVFVFRRALLCSAAVPRTPIRASADQRAGLNRTRHRGGEARLPT